MSYDDHVTRNIRSTTKTEGKILLPQFLKLKTVSWHFLLLKQHSTEVLKARLGNIIYFISPLLAKYAVFPRFYVN